MNPLDFLNENRNREVIISIKNGKEIEGVLVAFDLNINIYLKVHGQIRFINGFSIVTIREKDAR